MTPPAERAPMSWGEFAGLALLLGVVGLLVFSGRDQAQTVLPAGTPLPPLMAEGWLQAGAAPFDGLPTRERLAGKVIVVDCWATWCPPCRAAMPELARLYAQYHPLGVEFIGLTSESEQDRGAIEKFVGSVPGFDWPVGYGAGPTMDLLGINALPTAMVIGPSGTVVWSSNQLDGIEAALDQALASVR